MGHLIRPVRTEVGRVPSKLRMGIQLVESRPKCEYEANERLTFVAMRSQWHPQVSDGENKLDWTD